MIFDVDENDCDIVRLRCPNCGSRNPIIRGEKGTVDVLFPACGAHEILQANGHVHLMVECRIKKRKPRGPR